MVRNGICNLTAPNPKLALSALDPPQTNGCTESTMAAAAVNIQTRSQYTRVLGCPVLAAGALSCRRGSHSTRDQHNAGSHGTV
jgi:hypothetical protein